MPAKTFNDLTPGDKQIVRDMDTLAGLFDNAVISAAFIDRSTPTGRKDAQLAGYAEAALRNAISALEKRLELHGVLHVLYQTPRPSKGAKVELPVGIAETLYLITVLLREQGNEDTSVRAAELFLEEAIKKAKLKRE